MGDGGGGGGEKPDPEFTGKDVKQIQLKSVPASMKHEVKGDMGAVSDKTPKDVAPVKSPEQTANVFSKIFFLWMGGLMVKGWKKPLEQSDLPPLPDWDDAKNVADRFFGFWKDEQKRPKPSVTRALFRCFRAQLWWGGILQFITIALQLTPPIFLNAVLLYIQGRPTNNFMYQLFGKEYGYYAAAALFVGPTLTTVVNNQYYQTMFRLGIHVKTALVEVVYHKSLRLSNAARQTKSVGEVVTLMQVDTDKVSQTTPFLHVTWSAVLQVLGNLALLIYYIGWSALTGFALLIITVPTQGKLVGLLLTMQRRILLNTGKRVKVLNEVLQGMRVVKAYAWEQPFQKAITAIRGNEIAAMALRVWIRAAQSCLMFATPFIMLLVTFAFYAGVAGHPMDAAIVFTALSLFNGLRMPLMFYPFVLNAVLAGHVSLGRLGVFLASEELRPAAEKEEKEEAEKESGEVAIRVLDSSFQWSAVLRKEDAPSKKSVAKPGVPASKPEKVKKQRWGKKKVEVKESAAKEVGKDEKPFGISGISLSVSRGELVAVVGPVGSGKSSLAAALLGEMEQTGGGKVVVGGSVAYCTQQAWILNASLRENILFGHCYEEKRYGAVIEACALQQDLAVLPDGDLTEIGERGINLSGGQKQRVSLARAVYFDADTYVLDDPLSAVDAHVGAHLFDRCINGMLKGKTRVLVTNQLQYVPSADLVVVLKEGRIVETGAYQEVMDGEGEFKKLMMESGSAAENVSEAEHIDDAVSAQLDSSPHGAVLRVAGEEKGDSSAFSKEGMLVEKEHRAQGMLKLTVYWTYWTEASRIVPLGVLLLYGAVQAIDAYSRYWLSYWTADKFHKPLGFYLGIYGALALAFTTLTYFRTLGQALLGLWISRNLHEGMLASIFRAPMTFFDTTPVGRILNRFSADQSNVDETLPFSWNAFLNILFQVFSTIIVIIIVTPYWGLVFIPCFAVYAYVQEVYRRTARELKRLDAVSKSPVYQQFTETLNGLTTIRAYGQQERFLRMCDAKLDANNRAFFLLRCCDRWLSVRLETMGNILVAAAAFLAVSQKGTLYVGLAGISIDYALQITQSLSMLVRNMTDTENQMNGVERMLEYRDKIDHEGAAIVEENRAPKEWPAEGGIVIQDLSMRYRPSLPLVLKQVSFTVQPGEKVGVVGRTGSGKSSLMLCLFRLVEPVGGSITVDGIDISTIGLEDLRSRLSIIPQDPILFSGSVRSNLDPFGTHTDAAIWEALERAHLKEKICGVAGKLDAEVVEYGENFSVGERQLLCLARVLLRKTKILVMDEATSSVDFETDRLIQATIRAHLSDTTMLIIAHRINTVIDASRILVLSDGEVAEFDTPANLLDTPGSRFASLVQDTGSKTAEHLSKIAHGEIDFFSTYTTPVDEEDTEVPHPSP